MSSSQSVVKVEVSSLALEKPTHYILAPKKPKTFVFVFVVVGGDGCPNPLKLSAFVGAYYSEGQELSLPSSCPLPTTTYYIQLYT